MLRMLEHLKHWVEHVQHEHVAVQGLGLGLAGGRRLAGETGLPEVQILSRVLRLSGELRLSGLLRQSGEMKLTGVCQEG